LSQTSPIRRSAAKSRARSRLIELLDGGTVGPAGILPPEKDLAELCGVSRTPLRAVLEELEEAGRIRKEGRRGWMLLTDGGLESPMSQAVVVVRDHSEYASEVGHLRQGIEQVVLAAGRNAMVIQNIKRLDTPHALNWLLNNRPAGLIPSEHITHSPSCREPLERLGAAGVSVVVQAACDYLEPFDQVIDDQEGGGYDLTRLLLERGCRRIRRLWAPSPADYWNPLRYQGYLRAHAEAGVTPYPDQEPMGLPDNFNRTHFDSKANVTWMTGVLAQDFVHGDDAPDAIMAPADSFCEIVGMALDILYRDRPERRPVVVGFDGGWEQIETDENRAYRPLATAVKNPTALGAEIAKTVLQRIGGTLGDAPERRRVPMRLRVFAD
jgi:DNA-binding LacI/PurR family transcriptional regulator